VSLELDCVIYCAFYSILFRGAFFPGHGVVNDLTLQITKRTALMAAANRGSVELCRALLSTGIPVDDVTDHVTFKEKRLEKNKPQETRAGTHAVHEAARGAHVRVLQVLVT